MQSNLNESDKTLVASVHDVRYIVALLRGVSFNKQSLIQAKPEGLAVTVEDARTLTATAYIFKGLFDEYHLNPERPPPSSGNTASEGDEDEPETTAFEVPLETLIECLNIFGSAGANPPSKPKRWRTDNGDQDDGREGSSTNATIDSFFASTKGTGMRMSYVGAGYPLMLLLAEDATGPTAACEITTFDPEPMLDLEFDESTRVAKIIMKSSWLRDALSEIDSTCDKLTIICNPPPPAGQSTRHSSTPRLRLKASGDFGTTEMDYPADKEVLEFCECTERVSFSYSFKHISRVLRALQSSTKTSLRISDEGLLSLQLLMPSPKPRAGSSTDAFIEFRCLPLDDDF